MCSGEMTLKTVIGLQRSEQDIINEMTEVVIICYIDEVTKQFLFYSYKYDIFNLSHNKTICISQLIHHTLMLYK